MSFGQIQYRQQCKDDAYRKSLGLSFAGKLMNADWGNQYGASIEWDAENRGACVGGHGFLFRIRMVPICQTVSLLLAYKSTC